MVLVPIIIPLRHGWNESFKNDSKVPEGTEDFVEYFTTSHLVTIHYENEIVTVENPSPATVNIITNGADVVVTSSEKYVEYRLTGTSNNGRFKLYSDYKSRVTLSGITLHNPIGAPINIQSGKRIFMVLSDGTTNTLSDGTDYTLEGTEDMKGTIFSEGQLVFSGNGNLIVEGNTRHAIASDDYIRMRSGNINITTAVRDGVHTKLFFLGEGGTMKINCQDDGIDVRYGDITITGGSYNIQSVDKGLVTSYDPLTNTAGDLVIPNVVIKGGVIDITTTGDRAHGIESVEDVEISAGNITIKATGFKSDGIQAVNTITLSGGVVDINVTDDCTNGTLIHTAGTLECNE